MLYKPFFALIIFLNRVFPLFQTSLHHDPPIYASVAGMTDVCHHTQLFLG
jgi:hypothetical protein